MSWVAAAVAGAAVVGGVASSAMSSSASRSAASKQSDSAKYAADLQDAQWQQTQDNLKPYMTAGQAGINPYINALGYSIDSNWGLHTDPNNPLQQQFSYGAFNAPTYTPTAAFTAPSAQQAEASPGYQFTLNQGLKATQNSAAARGLGTSGAALKGASSYATGLADSTYNDVYNRALNAYNSNVSANNSNYTTQFNGALQGYNANYNTASNVFNTNYNSAAGNANRLATLVGSGQNAAATNGSLGAQAASGIGNTLTSGANATASGIVGSANAISGSINSLGNNALTAAMLYQPTTNNAASYGAANAANSTGYNVGSNSYGFTA